MSGVFLIHNDGLVQMNEQSYDSEDLLQELLATYPSLLAGEQMDSRSPRRWLLVRREVGVPCQEDGSNRWSVDHLFLDQDGIPTLVEVKRSNDTRIRREVVGQMLDYAANAVVYLPVENIRARFEQRCEESKLDPEQQLQEHLGDDGNPDQFWQMVKTNLQAGKVRMVFVADVIPPELRRIVEFLNEQMDPAEVLAVEIKQYTGQGFRSLIPRVMGQTAEAEKKKGLSSKSSKKWDEASFLQKLVDQKGSDYAVPAKKILDWLKQESVQVTWGSGIYGAFTAILPTATGKQWLVYVSTAGTVCIPFGWMLQRPPFDDLGKRVDLIHRVNEIPGVNWTQAAAEKFPNFSLAILSDPNLCQRFLGILTWIKQQIMAV